MLSRHDQENRIGLNEHIRIVPGSVNTQPDGVESNGLLAQSTKHWAVGQDMKLPSQKETWTHKHLKSYYINMDLPYLSFHFRNLTLLTHVNPFLTTSKWQPSPRNQTTDDGQFALGLQRSKLLGPLPIVKKCLCPESYMTCTFGVSLEEWQNNIYHKYFINKNNLKQLGISEVQKVCSC